MIKTTFVIIGIVFLSGATFAPLPPEDAEWNQWDHLPVVVQESRAPAKRAPAKRSPAQVRMVSQQQETAAPQTLQQDDAITVEEAVLKIIETVNVPAERSGIIRSLEATEGDLISLDQVIAAIDDRQTQLLVDQSLVELEIARQEAQDDISVRYARKALAVAEAELARMEELRAGNFNLVSDTELDRLNLIVDKSRLEIERSLMEMDTLALKIRLKEAELAVREDELSRYHVRCPIDGMVVNVEKRSGEWVNESETVMRVVRIDRLRVEGLVSAADAAEGLVDRPVSLTVAVPGLEDQEFTGKVVFVNPEANPFNMKVRIWAEVDNTELKLFPGWKANVQIHD